MDYEKKYKEALERAKKFKNGEIELELEVGENIMEYVFPELKESEYERIRKALIDYFDDANKADENPLQSYGIHTDKAIAWLEKQGEIDLEHYRDGENEKRKFVGYGFLKCKGDFLSFKEGETYWLEYVGNDNYNVRSDNLIGQTFHIKPVELYTVFRPTTWIEKQGKQETLCDKCRKENSYHSCQDITELGRRAVEHEQKPADKYEPKFKVGDWIVSIADPIQINLIKDGKYFTHNGTIGGDIRFMDKVYRLWTINDAKDGDILAASDNSIFIFKNVWGTSCKHYIALASDNEIRVNTKLDKFWETTRGVKPATKEERETLFEAMDNAGYTFDFEKKELKRIEQNPVEWTVEDEHNINAALSYIDDEYLRRWFKDIIHKNYDRPVEWSNADITRIDEIIETLNIVQENRVRTRRMHYSKATIDKNIDWLKSLKERIGE